MVWTNIFEKGKRLWPIVRFIIDVTEEVSGSINTFVVINIRFINEADMKISSYQHQWT